MIFGPEEMLVLTPPRWHAQPASRQWGRTRLFAPLQMASRTVLVPTAADGFAAFGKTLIWAAADPFNGNRFASTGKDLLIARNTSGSALTVTVRGYDSRAARARDQSQLIETGDTAHLGPFGAEGWRQPDDTIWIDAESAAVLLAVITLP
jgi:hypothetical protein